VVAVEQRFEHRVGEAGDEDIVEWVQAQPVVDPVDRVLREEPVHRRVERLCTGQVGPEGLLHHHPGALGPPRRRDALGDAAEQERGHLQVEQGSSGVAHLPGHRRVGGVVAQIAVDVAEQAEQPLRRR
jgi:hypothetical protein